MLKLSDDSNERDKDSERPTWDQFPETQIVEITPDSDVPALPPSMEQDMIKNILNGSKEIFRLPNISQLDRTNSVN